MFKLKRKFDLEQPTIHAIWIEVKYRSAAFLLCNIYRSPGTPVAFWSNFNKVIEKALESNKNLIIVGDFNQELLDESESHLPSIISLNTLTNVITKPTRITRNSTTLIDPILVTDSINVKYVDILDVDSDISDHKATSILIKFNYKPKLCSK